MKRKPLKPNPSKPSLFKPNQLKPRDKVFEKERARLSATAYRMLGSNVEAEDVVQDTYLRWSQRWHKQDLSAVRNPSAFLMSTLVRLCIDQLRHRKLVQYKGPWLPEPLPTAEARDPSCQVLNLESLNTGLMKVIERLSPVERAVFMLYEVFDYSHRDIAETLGVSLPNSRQLLSRARRSIQSETDLGGEPARTSGEPLVNAFFEALETGDMSAVAKVLCEDVVAYSDGGGKATAALVPLRGIDQVATVFGHLLKRAGNTLTWHWTSVNGQQGLVLYESGKLISVTTFDIRQEKIFRIYVMRNPDKLRGFPATVA